MTKLHRRNFLPTVMFNLILWISTVLIVFFLDPEKIVNFKLYLPRGEAGIVHFDLRFNMVLFFIALTLSLTLTLSLLFGNTRRGFIASLFITSVLILRLTKFFYWWPILILLVSATSLELFLANRHKKQDNKITRLR